MGACIKIEESTGNPHTSTLTEILIFDSYGRQPKLEFKKFEILLRGLFHFFHRFGQNELRIKQNLSIDKFRNYGLSKQFYVPNTYVITTEVLCNTGIISYKMTIQMYAANTARISYFT